MIPTQDQVRHVAKLARLHLTDTEVTVYQEQLASIFGYIEKLQEVDISSIKEAKHASRDEMIMRKDEVNMPDNSEKLLAVTHQEIIGGHIAIPAIMKKK
ncbi:Asp-tRNA(Asn)/Glu-tRNA(Gln) amidotransferase subunit GatC [Candidatus Peribacteria bacterium]|nr:Asp-tRNA(Asn)/Glu-tRNA(Gln) amidotransferase subunit GatC [Candidatus Peribacteria bacterium]